MAEVQPQTVQRTADFDAWLSGLKHSKGRQAITARIVRMEAGLAGDVKSLGDGVSEMRVDVGPGYRVYYHKRGRTVTLLLCGGDKSSQEADIAKAKAMVLELKKEEAAETKKRRK